MSYVGGRLISGLTQFSALAVSVSGGASIADINTATNAAKNAVENNYLNHLQVYDLKDRLAACKGDQTCANARLAEAKQLSDQQKPSKLAGDKRGIKDADNGTALLNQMDQNLEGGFAGAKLLSELVDQNRHDTQEANTMPTIVSKPSNEELASQMRENSYEQQQAKNLAPPLLGVGVGLGAGACLGSAGCINPVRGGISAVTPGILKKQSEGEPYKISDIVGNVSGKFLGDIYKPLGAAGTVISKLYEESFPDANPILIPSLIYQKSDSSTGK